MVLPDGEAVLGLDALLGDARADDLREAVDVDSIDSESPFDLGTHAFGPGFGTENADLERGRGGINTQALHLLDEVETVRRRDRDQAGFEVGD